MLGLSPDAILLAVVNVVSMFIVAGRIAAKLEGRFVRIETHLQHVLHALKMGEAAPPI